eukprot:767368-Hanusia_phi.AAC.5
MARPHGFKSSFRPQCTGVRDPVNCGRGTAQTQSLHNAHNVRRTPYGLCYGRHGVQPGYRTVPRAWAFTPRLRFRRCFDSGR